MVRRGVMSLGVVAMLLAGSGAARAAEAGDPRKTLLAVYEALGGGDVAAAVGGFTFRDKQEEETATLNLAQKWGGRKVVAAAVARWGDEARKAFGSESQDTHLADLTAYASCAEITVEGDVATVGKKREANPNAETELSGVQLKKVGESWKIVAETFSDIASDVRPRERALMKAMQEGAEKIGAQIIVEIGAGKFATAQAAYDAYAARLQEAVRAGAAGGGGRTR